MCAAAIGCEASGTDPAGGTASPPPSTNSFVPTSTTTTPTSEADKTVDYSRLLLQPADVSDSEDTFTEQSTTPSGPDGLPRRGDGMFPEEMRQRHVLHRTAAVG